MPTLAASSYPSYNAFPINEDDERRMELLVSTFRHTVGRQVRQLQIMCFFVTLAVTLPSPTFPYFFTKRLRLSSGNYGLMVGASSLAHLAGAIAYGRLSDQFGRRRVLIFQTGLGFCLYLAFAIATQLNDSSLKFNCILLFILLGCSNTVNLLTCSAVCDLCLPTKLRDANTGHIQMVNFGNLRPKFLAQVAGILGLASAVGPPLGQLLQRAISLPDSPMVVLLLAALANIAGGLVAWGTVETTSSKERPSVCNNHLWLVPTGDSATGVKSESSFQRCANSPLLREAHCLCVQELEKSTASLPQQSPPPSPLIELVSTDSIATRTSIGDQLSSSVSNLNRSPHLCISQTSSKTSFQVISGGSPDWTSVKYIYLCQLLKSLSLTSITVCYALVLDLLLPPQWLFGLNAEQVIAISLCASSLVRVSIQLGCFQQILLCLGGPGAALMLGFALMAAGQIATYWSIADLPRLIYLADAVQMQNYMVIVLYALLHFLLVGAILSSGQALVEPSLSALLALGVAEHKNYQGLAQGFNSAVNQLGSTIGPPLMGWLLAMKPMTISHSNCDPSIESNLSRATDSFHELASQLGTIWASQSNPFLSRISDDEYAALATEQANSLALKACSTQGARPLLPFAIGALMAVTPLFLGRRILRLSQGWDT